ncbi:unnamed protein product [Pocillopora meandrina]|uniref:Uncharacterized protein n=1 Tax=Pocillopora meandrina TaxID=46732 RepID=A0AAU9X043_9CNID|nr:unnamed protein product [Pocillopora meandrina]
MYSSEQLQNHVVKSVTAAWVNQSKSFILSESVDFFQAYEIYCSKQVKCPRISNCRKMDLNSFILAPVQRIIK